MSSRHHRTSDNYWDHRRRRSRSPDRRGGYRDRRYDRDYPDSRDYHGSSSRSRHRSPDRYRHRSMSPREDRRRQWESRVEQQHNTRRGEPWSPSRRQQDNKEEERQQQQAEERQLSKWERLAQEEEEQQQQEQQQHQHLHGGKAAPSHIGHNQQPASWQPHTGVPGTAGAAPASVAAANHPTDSAALVLKMMQAPGGTAAAAAVPAAHAGLLGNSTSLDRQQKTKLLWGAKRDAAAAGVAPAFGANRWDAAEFGDEQQKLKFQRLMGARPAAGPQLQAQPGPASGGDPAAAAAEAGADVGPRVLGKEEQQKVLSAVEKQFVAGLRRADGRTVGLGL